MIGAFCDLETERLLIRPFKVGDLTERYVDWLNNPDIVGFSELRHYVHSLQSCEKYFERMKLNADWFLALLLRGHDPEHIGNLSVAFDRFNRVADMAILLGEESAQGKGLGKEAWNAVLSVLLDGGMVHKVTAGTMAENKPMIAVAEATSMHLEARLKDEFLLDGRHLDQLKFARFAPEFPHSTERTDG